jgi:hypothetical protein
MELLTYKFVTDISEQRRINSKVMQMDLASRRSFEKSRYEVLKKEKNGESHDDGSVSFYIISIEWF